LLQAKDVKWRRLMWHAANRPVSKVRRGRN